MKGRFRNLLRSELISERRLTQAVKYTVDIIAVGKRNVQHQSISLITNDVSSRLFCMQHNALNLKLIDFRL